MMMMMIVMINNIGDEGAFDRDFSTKSFSCTLLSCLINVYVVNIVFVGFLKNHPIFSPQSVPRPLPILPATTWQTRVSLWCQVNKTLLKCFNSILVFLSFVSVSGHFHNTWSDKLWKSRRVARLSLVVLFAQDAMEEVVKVKGDVPRWYFYDF